MKNDKSENSLKSLNMYNKAVISYINICMYVCMGVCMYVWMGVFMYECMNLCIYVCM